MSDKDIVTFSEGNISRYHSHGTARLDLGKKVTELLPRYYIDLTGLTDAVIGDAAGPRFTDALIDYVTDSEFTDGLTDNVIESQLTAAQKGYVTHSDFIDALAGYIRARPVCAYVKENSNAPIIIVSNESPSDILKDKSGKFPGTLVEFDPEKEARYLVLEMDVNSRGNKGKVSDRKYHNPELRVVYKEIDFPPV
ncbi:MAG: hypothetical protein U9Q92_00725 [archaeon]|nr:hypothetical protein [archaeon]